jgi:hypothetical protein
MLAGPQLPELVDAQATELLAAGRPVDDILPGQSSALLIANSLITGLLGIATGGYLLLARRSGDPQVGWLAMALAFLCVGQAHAVLFPPVVVDYGTSGDAFRVGGYLVLLSSLVTRLQLEIAERASQAERLRLSRELHDGLTQQLALLSLRLAQTGAKPCSAESHARELEVARRQVESALLEARQAICILRTGSVAWDRFEETGAHSPTSSPTTTAWRSTSTWPAPRLRSAQAYKQRSSAFCTRLFRMRCATEVPPESR